MAKLVFHTYAQALFEVAVEEENLNRVKDELEFIIKTFDEYPSFYEIFVTPRISKEERKQVVESVFQDKISKAVLNFMKILIDKRRGSAIQGIYKVFVNMADEKQGIVKVNVKSAVELTELEKTRLTQILSKVTEKTIQLNCVVKPEILGGLVVEVGDKVIDGSVRNQLDGMKDSLAQLIV